MKSEISFFFFFFFLLDFVYLFQFLLVELFSCPLLGRMYVVLRSALSTLVMCVVGIEFRLVRWLCVLWGLSSA